MFKLKVASKCSIILDAYDKEAVNYFFPFRYTFVVNLFRGRYNFAPSDKRK